MPTFYFQPEKLAGFKLQITTQIDTIESIYFQHSLLSTEKTPSTGEFEDKIEFEDKTEFEDKIKEQINHFLQQPFTHQWQLKLNMKPLSLFQQRVLLRLQQIPAGQIITYGKLADELKTSARAIGNACRNNPFPLIIPCHRVVGKNHLGGYDGDSKASVRGPLNKLRIKEMLLKNEGIDWVTA